jgi:hypothetical protein
MMRLMAQVGAAHTLLLVRAESIVCDENLYVLRLYCDYPHRACCPEGHRGSRRSTIDEAYGRGRVAINAQRRPFPVDLKRGTRVRDCSESTSRNCYPPIATLSGPAPFSQRLRYMSEPDISRRIIGRRSDLQRHVGLRSMYIIRTSVFSICTPPLPPWVRAREPPTHCHTDVKLPRVAFTTS